MDANEALRLDYEQTTELMRTLTDIRFKLLAFVPTIAGAAVGFMGSGQSAADLLAVGFLGLAATFGVLLYELRNWSSTTRSSSARSTSSRSSGSGC